MAGMGSAPCRAMVAEDIRNLQSRVRHACASAGRPDLLELERDMLQRAHDLADRLGGDPGIERGGVELGKPSSTWMMRTSMSCSSRWVAKLCRKVCSETRLLISAICAAA